MRSSYLSALLPNDHYNIFMMKYCWNKLEHFSGNFKWNKKNVNKMMPKRSDIKLYQILVLLF